MQNLENTGENLDDLGLGKDFEQARNQSRCREDEKAGQPGGHRSNRVPGEGTPMMKPLGSRRQGSGPSCPGPAGLAVLPPPYDDVPLNLSVSS